MVASPIPQTQNSKWKLEPKPPSPPQRLSRFREEYPTHLAIAIHCYFGYHHPPSVFLFIFYSLILHIWFTNHHQLSNTCRVKKNKKKCLIKSLEGKISRRKPRRSSVAGACSVPNTKMLPIYTKRPPIVSNSPNPGDQAGAVYVKLAECHVKLDSKHEAANAYADAAHCYKKTSTRESIAQLEQALNLFMDIGRLSMSARYCKEIAELYEQDQNLEQAIVYYDKAADLFQGEEVTTSANQCKQKIAQFAAELEQYQKSIEIYEDIARQSLNNNLLKYGVKGHLLNAGICQLCKDDVVAITNALERYQELDPTFSGTREYRLLADLAAAIDEEDVTKFTDAVKEFDSMTKLDAWKTTLLLRVKESLKAKEMEDDDLT